MSLSAKPVLSNHDSAPLREICVASSSASGRQDATHREDVNQQACPEEGGQDVKMPGDNVMQYDKQLIFSQKKTKPKSDTTAFASALEANVWKRENRLYLSSSGDGGDREAGSDPSGQLGADGRELTSEASKPDLPPGYTS